MVIVWSALKWIRIPRGNVLLLQTGNIQNAGNKVGIRTGHLCLYPYWLSLSFLTSAADCITSFEFDLIHKCTKKILITVLIPKPELPSKKYLCNWLDGRKDVRCEVWGAMTRCCRESGQQLGALPREVAGFLNGIIPGVQRKPPAQSHILYRFWKSIYKAILSTKLHPLSDLLY